ncbi:MAG: FKBP-type peptidyl-prolyl cis-trans isomerase [Vicingaceae bacterium]
MRQNFLISFFCCLLFSCSLEDEKSKKLNFDNREELEKTLILSHQAFLKKERQRIEAFIDSIELNFKKSGTGLRYWIDSNKRRDSLKSGDIAVISYKLQLLDGNRLYESPEGKAQEFAVDYDNVESGLHEGIKYMSVGDSAVFIIPAHLAHGITGDQAAIPSQATLVYYLKLKAKK